MSAHEAQLAAIPAEHPRWPDGEPVYVGQRVTWTETWAGVTTRHVGVIQQVEAIPFVLMQEFDGWGSTCRLNLDQLTRLDPEDGDPDD